MDDLIYELQKIGIATRLALPGRQDCRNCIRGHWSSTGDGWNEPRYDEWSCDDQHYELESLTDAYESVVGEIDYGYATICPLYRPWTEAERKAEAEFNW